MTIDSTISAVTSVPTASASAEDVTRVRDLVQPLVPIAPTLPVLAVGERFLDAASAAWLSLPVVGQSGVDKDRPVGSVSRYELMQRVYIKPFGRELHGKRPIQELMHTHPRVSAPDTTTEAPPPLTARRSQKPIMEDFIVIDGSGRYVGVGK